MTGFLLSLRMTIVFIAEFDSECQSLRHLSASLCHSALDAESQNKRDCGSGPAMTVFKVSHEKDKGCLPSASKVCFDNVQGPNAQTSFW